MAVVSYHDSVKFLQERNVLAASPFDRAEWLMLLETAGMMPLVAVAEDAKTFVALPLQRTQTGLESLANWYSFTWRVVSDQPVPDAALLEALARDIKRHSYRIILHPVPGEDGSAAALQRAFQDAGWAVQTRQCDDNHALQVGGHSFTQYWALRPGHMRTTLKRKGGKVDVQIHTRFDDAAWSAYEEIYAESWKPDEGHPDLLRQFAEAEGRAGRLRLGIARHEGKAVAAQFWTMEDGTAYIHKLAHREAHRSLSAGTTLSAAMFKYAIDTDCVSLIDFGTGNDRYKADWMDQVRPRYRIDCLDMAQPRAWPAMAKRTLSGFRVHLASSRPRS